ncbi:Arc family DNA-binding protein [Salmonella enterica]|uniref:Arc family DNA-binding protein n=1 Tax=Salmonella enterica subsp. enterica serovar Cotham TaxID=2572724 RepID=A0A5I0ZMG7_SALET|nr:Arc family DNA-binding protein [Salmonella enterica]EBP3975946.1 Arc family DNA-binding protein [Salmonella enterica subsp. enterica]EBS2730799.1 Arc family DNA-binding protein [Salmonella enterica subsp. enterica serovar Cotham]EBW2674245.1 Arc family DNA-binding protein [Salmonella enterica subsp. enterica serovar Tennessee]EBY0815427.1 Arc family DNA-binding protein [Salmonella enterica subsp. enterica serovar Lattenkamp]ECG0829752.1 Arc family DNA-binding protein [Salmonella enterica su
MSREDAQMKIRLPAWVKEKLETAAKENKRSMNAEVVDRLESTLFDDNAYGGTKAYSFTALDLAILEDENESLKNELEILKKNTCIDVDIRDELLLAIRNLVEILNRKK